MSRSSLEWRLLEWRPRPDSNRNRRFRKPELYPVELRGPDFRLARTRSVQDASRCFWVEESRTEMVRLWEHAVA